jgi:hypothetical protein
MPSSVQEQLSDVYTLSILCLYFFDSDLDNFDSMLSKMYIIRFRQEEIKGKRRRHDIHTSPSRFHGYCPKRATGALIMDPFLGWEKARHEHIINQLLLPFFIASCFDHIYV